MTEAILSVRELRKEYPVAGTRRRSGSKALVALGGVDLEVQEGEILAIVGESGSGKSTLGGIVAGANTASSGTVHFRGNLLGTKRSPEDRRDIQMVFQDPYSSLNPRLTVRQTLKELLEYHRVVDKNHIGEELVRLITMVGLDEGALDAYPGQFSGGQRQRIAIARALCVRPSLIVADEPVSALDVSVQATVLNLLAELRGNLNVSMLFITHNLAVVRMLAQRVAVMYLGRIVEVATVSELFENPRHPYTRALIASIPSMERRNGRSSAIQGEPPSPIDLPPGCSFALRCPFAQDICQVEDPKLLLLTPVGSEHKPTYHRSACHFRDELPATAQL